MENMIEAMLRDMAVNGVYESFTKISNTMANNFLSFYKLTENDKKPKYHMLLSNLLRTMIFSSANDSF